MTASISKTRQSPAAVGSDAGSIALAALGWVLGEDERAARFLALTGLDPDTLRAGLGETPVQAAVLEFLGNHEPDLIRCAEALALTPEELAGAAQDLAR